MVNVFAFHVSTSDTSGQVDLISNTGESAAANEGVGNAFAASASGDGRGATAGEPANAGTKAQAS